jgi:GTP-binding protein
VVGSPIRFEFRAGENPFANKVDRLTPRQKVKQDSDLKKGRRIKKTRQKSVKR